MADKSSRKDLGKKLLISYLLLIAFEVISICAAYFSSGADKSGFSGVLGFIILPGCFVLDTLTGITLAMIYVWSELKRRGNLRMAAVAGAIALTFAGCMLYIALLVGNWFHQAADGATVTQSPPKGFLIPTDVTNFLGIPLRDESYTKRGYYLFYRKADEISGTIAIQEVKGNANCKRKPGAAGASVLFEIYDRHGIVQQADLNDGKRKIEIYFEDDDKCLTMTSYVLPTDQISSEKMIKALRGFIRTP